MGCPGHAAGSLLICPSCFREALGRQWALLLLLLSETNTPLLLIMAAPFSLLLMLPARATAAALTNSGATARDNEQ